MNEYCYDFLFFRRVVRCFGGEKSKVDIVFIQQEKVQVKLGNDILN